MFFVMAILIGNGDKLTNIIIPHSYHRPWLHVYSTNVLGICAAGGSAGNAKEGF
jgi:hypothetical protein